MRALPLAAVLDGDGSGVVEFTEFAAALMQPADYLRWPLALQAAFQLCSRGKRRIVLKDLIDVRHGLLRPADHICATSELITSPQAFQLLFDQLDIDGDNGKALRRVLTLAVRFQRFPRRFGEWAVVTGGTDGIGEAVALALAREGMSIFLVSRTQARLDATKAKIEEQSFAATGAKVHVRTFAFDFSHAKWDEGRFAQLVEQLKGLPSLGLLYNNVGVSYPSSLFFEELPLEGVEDQLCVNVRAPLRLTHALLPKLKAQKKGAIVYVGSGASTIPDDPLLAAYAASKAALATFAKCLAPECAAANVLVQCHTPLLITTKLSGVKRTSTTVASPSQYAQATVKTLRNSAPSLWLEAVRCPFSGHALQNFFAQWVPLGLWHQLHMRQMLGLRRRYLAKQKTA